MGNRIFGTPKQPEEQKLSIRNIPTLEEQLSVLEKRRLYLEKTIELYEDQAKKSKTKEEAMRNLKLKLKHQDDLKSVYAMLDKLEGLETARQRIIFQKSVMIATEQANKTIKQHMIDPDKVNDTMFEVQTTLEEVDKVTQVLARTESPSHELEEEYNNLVAEKKEPEPVILMNLPDVPVQQPITIKIPKEEPSAELRMLVSS